MLRHGKAATRFITQNVFWAVVCAALVFIISGLWAANVRLIQQNKQLTVQLDQATQDTECIARDTWPAGTSRTFALESGNVTREYIVHLPADFIPTKTYPAVFYFSGKGKGARDSEQFSSYNQLPAIAVYPDPTIGKDGVPSWQGAPYSSSADDIAFTGQVLDKLTGQLCIERSRVYAVGVSNGGGFVGLLSCRMPDRFAAFGVVAGAFYEPWGSCTPKASAPIIAIHGDQDPTVPYFGSASRHLPDIDAWAQKKAVKNGCTGTPFVAHQAHAIVSTWQRCRDNATVQSIRQLGGGHAWTPTDRDIIWRFLSNR